MEHNELKPCPFCGGEVVIDSATFCAGHGDFYTRFQIRCRKCRKRGKVVYDRDGDDALRKEIERWNTGVKKTDIKAVKKCELNREQTIKGLQEIVDNYSGSWKRFNVLDNALSLIKSQEQRIFDLEKRLRYLLQSKTIQDYDEVDIHTKEYVKDIHSLDANIEHLNEWNKELTEENERLSGAVKMYEEEREYHFEMSRKKNAETKADTVRKMHSEIEARCIKGGIYPAFVARTIDQIAKEMVGV